MVLTTTAGRVFGLPFTLSAQESKRRGVEIGQRKGVRGVKRCGHCSASGDEEISVDSAELKSV